MPSLRSSTAVSPWPAGARTGTPPCAPCWRACRRCPLPRRAGVIGRLGHEHVGRALLFVALLAHGVLLHTTIFPQNAMVFGFAFALSAMFWLGAGIYWIESFFFPLDGLRLLVLPLACVASLMPLGFGGVRVLPYSAAPMFKLHFLIANIAYGLFAIAALHAILMLLVERRLHAMRGGVPQRNAAAAGNGWLSSWLDTLPPLLTLEKLLFRLIGAGFVLLTLTLRVGHPVQRATGRPRVAARSQDRVRDSFVGDVRRAADRAQGFRLARPCGVALGAGVVRRAAAGVRRQPFCIRGAVAPCCSVSVLPCDKFFC